MVDDSILSFLKKIVHQQKPSTERKSLSQILSIFPGSYSHIPKAFSPMGLPWVLSVRYMLGYLCSELNSQVLSGLSQPMADMYGVVNREEALIT